MGKGGKQDKIPVTKAAKTARRRNNIQKLRDDEMASVYTQQAPARIDGVWRDFMHHENSGKLSSMMKGLEMNYVSNIPVTESVAETINPEYFKDPFLMAQKSFDTGIHSPQFAKRNVFGNYKIQTMRDQANNREKVAAKNKTMLLNHNNDFSDGVYNTPRNENKYQQSTINPTNEIFDTKLRQSHTKCGKGTSIMSGDINKINKYTIKTYDQEKIPYAGSSIDISQPDLYRYDVNNTLSRNNPMIKCKYLCRILDY
jgi:hypothetical protein